MRKKWVSWYWVFVSINLRNHQQMCQATSGSVRKKSHRFTKKFPYVMFSIYEFKHIWLLHFQVTSPLNSRSLRRIWIICAGVTSGGQTLNKLKLHNSNQYFVHFNFQPKLQTPPFIAQAKFPLKFTFTFKCVTFTRPCKIILTLKDKLNSWTEEKWWGSELILRRREAGYEILLVSTSATTLFDAKS